MCGYRTPRFFQFKIEKIYEREIVKFFFKQNVYFLLLQIKNIVMRLLRNKRFTSISLSFFTNQIFYERVSKKNVKFKIRNNIDYLTTSQIFIN